MSHLPYAALHVPLRPRRSRRVAWALATAQLLVLGALAVVLPTTGPGAFQWYDRLGVVGVGAVVAWGLSRIARVRAVPGPQGVVVRNLLTTRELDWAEIVSVRFGGGGPWVTLDLADGETLPVMAVQRSDGAHGRAEATRLATLVALHSRTDRDD